MTFVLHGKERKLGKKIAYNDPVRQKLRNQNISTILEGHPYLSARSIAQVLSQNLQNAANRSRASIQSGGQGGGSKLSPFASSQGLGSGSSTPGSNFISSCSVLAVRVGEAQEIAAPTTPVQDLEPHPHADPHLAPDINTSQNNSNPLSNQAPAGQKPDRSLIMGTQFNVVNLRKDSSSNGKGNS